MNLKIAPSILSADFSKLGYEIDRVRNAGADMLHIDVMDGWFVPNISFGLPVIKSIRKVTDMLLDVHLMIDSPERFIDDFANAGADMITVHAESTKHLHRVIQLIKARGKRASVALNPATSIDVLQYVLQEVDMVLLLTVNPGFGGQKFIPQMIEKISKLRSRIDATGLPIDLQIDGGAAPDNIYEISKAGANVIVAGSAIFCEEDAQKVIDEFRKNAFSR